MGGGSMVLYRCFSVFQTIDLVFPPEDPRVGDSRGPGPKAMYSPFVVIVLWSRPLPRSV
jgi:hypothetical protein